MDLRLVLRAQAERLGLQMLTVQQKKDGEGGEINLWTLLTKDAALLKRAEFQRQKLTDDGRKVLWTDARSDLMAIRAKRE